MDNLIILSQRIAEVPLTLYAQVNHGRNNPVVVEDSELEDGNDLGEGLL